MTTSKAPAHMYTRRIAIPCLFAPVAILLFSLLRQSEPVMRVDPATDQEKAVAAGGNAFAIELYKQLAQEEGNLFFSPYSLSTALAMTYAGARGRTAQEMTAVLHFPADQDALHAPLSTTTRALNTIGQMKGCRLNVANALWGRAGEPYEQTFLDLIQKFYGGALTLLDFSQPAEAARRINSWASDNTHGKIQEVIPPNALQGPTVLVLTNAIYFKGDWARQFDRGNTHDARFFVGAKTTVAVPMMFQETEFRTSGRRFQRGKSLPDALPLNLLELPYKQDHLSMVILLPYGEAEDPIAWLRDAESRLTPENLQAHLEDLYRQKPGLVQVWMPKIHLRWGASLKPSLERMGMHDPFTPGADFSGITRQPAWISDVLHQAYVDVNEEGTEAAAASAVTLTRGGPPMFNVDHPFLFLIRDNRTGAILFLGRVINPLGMAKDSAAGHNRTP